MQKLTGRHLQRGLLQEYLMHENIRCFGDIWPTEDDSDLEFELEAVPHITAEASSQVAKCIEAIMPSSMAPEAPLSDVHICRASPPAVVRSAMILNSVPKKQALMPDNSEASRGSETSRPTFPTKRKRNSWTAQEEKDLIAIVKKHGEGNWMNILKENFKYDRTPSQLSQRWNIIKKRLTSLKLDGDEKISSWVLHNEQLATRKTISMALNIPMIGSLSALPSAPKKSQETSVLPQKTMKKSPGGYMKNQASLVSPNGLIQAAVVAAGGRIIDPSAAASLLKATNSMNVHHIKNGEIPISKFKHTF